MPLRTLIVIPCYNEALRLDTRSFLSFLEEDAGRGILFVNDGSTDETGRMLDNMLRLSQGRANVLHLPKNSGKAEAVRQGFLKGFTFSPQFIGYLDADLAAPLTCVSELEALLSNNGKEIAMGSRVALLGRRIERNNLRHYAGRVFATFASMILGLRVYDTQCGAKLFRVTDRLQRIFALPFEVKWIFDVEILARFMITERSGKNYRKVTEATVEHPLQEWTDKKGSKVRLKDFIVSGIDLFRIFFIMRGTNNSRPYVKILIA